MPGGKRHYRVAKREIEQLTSGIYINEEQKTLVIIVAISLLLAVFVKGMLIGILFGRD